MFNPHHNVTSNGVLITIGLKVLDYNRDITAVVSDLNDPSLGEYKCCVVNDPINPNNPNPNNLSMGPDGLEVHQRGNDLMRDNTEYCEHVYKCNHDHWFRTANGGMFNGSRLKALSS